MEGEDAFEAALELLQTQREELEGKGGEGERDREGFSTIGCRSGRKCGRPGDGRRRWSTGLSSGRNRIQQTIVRF